MKCDYSVDEESLPNYKIFWVDERQQKHVVEKFKAENDETAYAHRDEYCCEHTDHKYFWGKMYYVKCMTSSGKVITRALDESHDCMLDNDMSLFMKIISAVGDFFACWLWQKPIDWWYKLKDVMYLLKYKEARSNQWNLDQHLIDSLELNLPSLIENSHGLMFLDDAILKLHENEKDFDIKKYHEQHCNDYPSDVEKLALDIQHAEYSTLLLNVKLYKYFTSYGIIDHECQNDIEFDKKWRHLLPVKPGTYDEFDYIKLQELRQKSWNDIWSWVKEHGHTLYD